MEAKGTAISTSSSHKGPGTCSSSVPMSKDNHARGKRSEQKALHPSRACRACMCSKCADCRVRLQEYPLGPRIRMYRCELRFPLQVIHETKGLTLVYRALCCPAGPSLLGTVPGFLPHSRSSRRDQSIPLPAIVAQLGGTRHSAQNAGLRHYIAQRTDGMVQAWICQSSRRGCISCRS